MTDPALAALDCPSRRGVLRTLAGIGVGTIAAGVLVACGSSDPVAGTTPATGTPDGASGGTDGGATGGSDGGAGEASVALADVPVGQAAVVDALGARYVVAQPTEGEVVAFSAVCTHAGTIVEAVGGLELVCPNHGSRFDASDGAVEQGPANGPLPQIQARIEGDQIVLSA